MFLGLDFSAFAIIMMIYSIMGWVYESSVYSLFEQGRFMNRGYFIGPYCPIYAVVTIVNVFLLKGVQNPFMIILLAGITCAIIEFITSYILEKLFHARYWDYSNYPLNFQGRISVPSSIFFGLAVLLAVRVVHPFTSYIVLMMPYELRVVVSALCVVTFSVDLIITTVGMINLNNKCKRIYEMMDQMIDGKTEVLNSKKDYFNRFAFVKVGRGVVVQIKGVSNRFLDFETRILRERPDFKSTRYGEVFERLKHAVARKKGGRKQMEDTIYSDSISCDKATQGNINEL